MGTRGYRRIQYGGLKCQDITIIKWKKTTTKKTQQKAKKRKKNHRNYCTKTIERHPSLVYGCVSLRPKTGMATAGDVRCFCLEPPDMVMETLPCGCRCHVKCLVAYILSKIGDRSQFSSGDIRIQCPYGNTLCSNPSSSLSISDLRSIASRGGHNVLPLEQIDDLQKWAKDRDCSVFMVQSDSEKKRSEANLDPFVLATTKACPNCSVRSTHWHGHQCHHISPATKGCPSCHVNYCYRCLATEVENSEKRFDPSRCICGYWGNFCAPIRSAKDIELYIESKPVPFDRRCGCVICPDCCFNQPCDTCPGNCVVCLGYMNPGPRDLDSKFSVQVPGGFFEHRPGMAQLLLLQESCYQGDVPSCLQILNHRFEAGSSVDVNALDPDGRSCIHLAVLGGNRDCVALMLELCPEIDVNLADFEGWSPFMAACKDGNLDIAKIVALTGLVEVNQTSENGYSALFTSCCNGHTDVVRFLTEHAFHPPIDINKTDHTGYSPFLMAARNGHLDIVELLLGISSLDMNRSSRLGCTALYWAERNKHVEVAQAIRDRSSLLRRVFTSSNGCVST